MGQISTIIKNIKEKIKKEDTNSSVTTKKKETSQAPSSGLHLEG